MDIEVTQNNKLCAIFRKIAEECIHLVKEVIDSAWCSVDHSSVELDWKGNIQSMDWKCRSGYVFQEKDQQKDFNRVFSPSSACHRHTPPGGNRSRASLFPSLFSHIFLCLMPG